MYHGPVSQRAKFTAILSEIYAFLRAHPSESLLITLKEEIPPNDPNFGRMVWEAIEPGDTAGYWYRQPRVPSLGEVRGKAILMSRFTGGKEWEAGIGWAPAWPNDRKESETELTGDGSMFRLQDWCVAISGLLAGQRLNFLGPPLSRRGRIHLPIGLMTIGMTSD